MKSLFKGLFGGLMLLMAMVLTSCEHEVQNDYHYGFAASMSMTAETGLNANLGTGATELSDYMTRIGMLGIEDFDNEARDADDARAKNDAEAKNLFDMRVRLFNEEVLKDIYKKAGYISVQGFVPYTCVRNDGIEVARHVFEFNFTDLNPLDEE